MSKAAVIRTMVKQCGLNPVDVREMLGVRQPEIKSALQRKDAERATLSECARTLYSVGYQPRDIMDELGMYPRHVHTALKA